MENIFRQIIKCEKCIRLGVDYRRERRENLEYAYDYKPSHIKVLWILESPPKSEPPRYFYRPELTRYDGLYREIMKSLGITSINPKNGGLREFQKLGHFLVDIAKCPVDKDNSHLKSIMIENCLEIFRSEVVSLYPEKILIIKSNVHKPAYQCLQEIGFENRVLNREPIPYPGHGNQRKYGQAILKCMKMIEAYAFHHSS